MWMTRRTSMKKHALTAGFGAILVLGTAHAMAADTRNEVSIDIAPDGAVNVVNSSGTVSIHAGSGRQVTLSYVTRSNKVEVDHSVTPDKRRVELRTHALTDQRPTGDEMRVDYDVAVPAGVSVSINTATAPITVDGLSGEITLSSATGQIVA